MNKLLLIGFGNMGKAFYKGMLRTLPPESVFVCDRNEDKLLEVPESNRTTDINKFIAAVDAIIFAVKPQSFKETVSRIKKDLSNKNIISMMAGKPFSELKELTNARDIIRIMPNLAVEFGKGITLWLSIGEKFNIREILANMGVEVEMDSEEQFNSMTLITGSGQAFYFYLSEIFEKKAVSLGVPKEKANELVRMVLSGSSEMLSRKTEDFETLRKNVTSKGGMTEASLNYLIDKGLEDMVNISIDKGSERGKKID